MKKGLKIGREFLFKWAGYQRNVRLVAPRAAPRLLATRLGPQWGAVEH